jgi:hypothetical protein
MALFAQDAILNKVSPKAWHSDGRLFTSCQLILYPTGMEMILYSIPTKSILSKPVMLCHWNHQAFWWGNRPDAIALSTVLDSGTGCLAPLLFALYFRERDHAGRPGLAIGFRVFALQADGAHFKLVLFAFVALGLVR